jgi:hypothetical protein
MAHLESVSLALRAYMKNDQRVPGSTSITFHVFPSRSKLVVFTVHADHVQLVIQWRPGRLLRSSNSPFEVGRRGWMTPLGLLSWSSGYPEDISLDALPMGCWYEMQFGSMEAVQQHFLLWPSRLRLQFYGVLSALPHGQVSTQLFRSTSKA